MKVFVASSAELKKERMELVDLMLDLNDELESRGMRFRSALWEFLGSEMGVKHKEEEYLEELRTCGTCLVLFWKTLGNYTVVELDEAVAEMNAGRQPKQVVALFKEPADDLSPELAAFKDSFSQRYPTVPAMEFRNKQELRELATKILMESTSAPQRHLSDEEPSLCKGTSVLKEVKVMVAASEELHEEMMNFSGLVEYLNHVLVQRGMELKRMKWNPAVDGSLEDYQAKLKYCEMCLSIYWRDLAVNSREELDTAYQELWDNNNPRKLYVFFKEPSENLTELLRDFKASFETNYGHFYCKFENPDTMNLQFILQFEAYQNDLQNDFVKVSKGTVIVGGREMVNLRNVPFAALNKEYQRLQGELLELDRRLDDARKRFLADPDNEDLEGELSDARLKRDKLTKEFEEYQNHLYDIALSFAKMSGERYSERMRLARELFEKGDNIEADEILDMEEMKRDRDRELAIRHNLKLQSEQNENNIDRIIEEFLLKASTVMANATLSIPSRFASACKAYEEAIKTAKEVDYDIAGQGQILFHYACLLQKFDKMQEAVVYYGESLGIFRDLGDTDPDAYIGYVATILNNLAVLHTDLNRFDKAEVELKEALNIKQRLAVDCHEYIGDVAAALNNLAALHSRLNRLVEAEDEYAKVIEIYRELDKENQGMYIADVASALHNLAVLHSDLKQFDKAEAEYKEALAIGRRLAKADPDAYKSYIANTLNCLANLHKFINCLEEAEFEYKEALDVFSELAMINPDVYKGKVAVVLNNLANHHMDLGRIVEAEKEFKEALSVFKGLAEKNPDANNRDVAMTLHNLAGLHLNTNRLFEAEREYHEALEIRRGLAEGCHDAYTGDVAMTLYDLGLLHSSLDPHKAEKEFKEALDIYREFAGINPSAYTENVVASLNNLAMLHFERKCFEDAEVEFKELLEICKWGAVENSDSYKAKALNKLATLHMELNRFAEAENEFKKAREIYRALAKDKPGVFMSELTMNIYGLAILHMNLGNFEKAEAEFNETLQISRELAAEKPTMNKVVAETLSYLAALHSSTGCIDEAVENYNEALDIYRNLSKDGDPDAHLGDIANTLFSLASLHQDLFCLDQADEEYDEALGIYRGLAKNNPAEYKIYVAKILTNHAVLLKDLYRFVEAEGEFGEALGIMRELAADRTDESMKRVASALQSLAQIHCCLERFVDAEEEFNEALEIRRELARTNPDEYLGYVALTLHSLAGFHQNLNRFDEAEAEYREALEIYRVLAKDKPEECGRKVAEVLHNLANLCWNLNRTTEAEANYREEQETWRMLAEDDSDIYMGNAAFALECLANLHRELLRFDEAEAELKEALGIFRRLAENHPGPYLERVVKTLIVLADVHKCLNRFDEARAESMEARAIWERWH